MYSDTNSVKVNLNDMRYKNIKVIINELRDLDGKITILKYFLSSKFVIELISNFPKFTHQNILEVISNFEWSDSESRDLLNILQERNFNNHIKQEVMNAFNIDEEHFILLTFEYFKLLVILNRNSDLIIPENWVWEFWKIHLADEDHYSDLTSTLFAEYLPYKGSSVFNKGIDVNKWYDIFSEKYQEIFQSQPLFEIWKPFREEDEPLIRVNLFNLITWEASMFSFRENQMLV